MIDPQRGVPGRIEMAVRLSIGLLAVSSGAILIRLAGGEAPDLAIAFWRLAIAAAVFLAIAGFRGGLSRMSRSSILWSLASGLALALHFSLWVASLRMTTVASSTLFVGIHPAIVALGAIVFLKERPSKRLALAIVVTLVGGAIIGAADVRLEGPNGLGDLMAAGGGVMAAVYFLIGRHVRRTVPLPEYAALTYGSAALLVAAVSLCTGTNLLGFSGSTYGTLILLSIGPQLIGHSTFNWALRHLDASRVSILVLGEPIGASILAFALFGERPGWSNMMGAVIILLGIYLSLGRTEEVDHGRTQDRRASED